MAKYTDKQAQDELKRLIDEIDNVRKKPRLSPKFKSWQVEASELLEKLFGRNSKQVKEFDKIPYSLAAFSNQTPDSKFDEAFQQGLKTAAIALSSAIKEIQSNGIGGKSRPATVAPAPPPPPPPQQKVPVSEAKDTVQKTRQVTTDSKKVLLFAAAGDTNKKEVLEFFTKIGLNPLAVSCNTSEHDRLLVEAEKHDDAGYALILLDSSDLRNENENAFGLGLIVGSMGRDRVCVLLSDKMTGIDTYSGITYVPVDAAGAWKFMMIRNLKIAGFDVDANLAL